MISNCELRKMIKAKGGTIECWDRQERPSKRVKINGTAIIDGRTVPAFSPDFSIKGIETVYKNKYLFPIGRREGGQ